MNMSAIDHWEADKIIAACAQSLCWCCWSLRLPWRQQMAWCGATRVGWGSRRAQHTEATYLARELQTTHPEAAHGDGDYLGKRGECRCGCCLRDFTAMGRRQAVMNCSRLDWVRAETYLGSAAGTARHVTGHPECSSPTSLVF